MQWLETIRARFVAWLNDHPDDWILNRLLGTVIAATVVVLAYDYYQMAAVSGAEEAAITEGEPSPAALPDFSPSILPSILPQFRTGGGERRMPFRKPDGKLAEKMTFDLVGDGRLIATGMIAPGTAEAFKGEVEKRGGYIKTVVLNSTGGSVSDAIAMGRLIRERKFSTAVENGNFCASSCPLVFAGGVDRRAGDKAAIGVHQVFSPTDDPAANNMNQAQRISAECQKFLVEMGVDPKLWIHAMETPKEELYRLQPDELIALKLATARGGEKSAAALTPSGS
ncbi:MAG TPA: hypothetical protein VKT73_13665 [Xanthobacteraceae bacterium]|nr:hypothetical protein [Xanthobacteraceae bacterium]